MRFFNIRFNRLFRILGFRGRPRHYAYTLENIAGGGGICSLATPQSEKENSVYSRHSFRLPGNFGNWRLLH